MRANARAWWPALACMVLALSSACQRGLDQLDAASADAWARLIVAHTTGVVPRRSEIHVLFANDITLADAKKGAPLEVSPSVDGEVSLQGTRDLVFRPAAELKPGREYRVRLVPKALAGVPHDITPYEFNFVVQTPQFDVALDDLASDAVDDRLMVQRGTVTTADSEDSAAVEKMLRTNWRGNPLPVTWTHSGDGRVHVFTLQGVERQQEAQALRIDLAGDPIKADRDDNRSVTVPPLGQFSVVNAQALEDAGRKQLQVTFSDRLDDMQDLRGLVRLSAGGFTTRIEGNQLLVYPAEDAAGGEVTLTIEPGIRNRRGDRLAQQSVWTLALETQKPQVRFVGNGVILPDAKQMTVPFEAVGVRSVQVTATRVYPENIPQFLQVNALGGEYEMGRVGRYLWRKTLALTGPRTGRWQRYDLDVTELMQKFPGSLIQLQLRITPADSAYACPGGAELARAPRNDLADQEDNEHDMRDAWRYSEEYFGVADGGEVDYRARWEQRKDPCRNAYYQYDYDNDHKVTAQRNLLASNLGLLAKADARGRLLVSVTSLATAQPMSGVTLQVRNFQNQLLASGSSDRDGMATLEPGGTPFLLVAQNGSQYGYLRLNAAGSLPVSHFDVGGETVQKGLKGTLYGERGVWRPGDAMGLIFVVNDREGTLPANHPATLELSDPRGRVVQTLVNSQPVDGFYRFDARTAPDAPTGNWTAKVTLGGATFTRALKVETVMPNRLKLTLDMGEALLGGGAPLRGSLASQWLSGATAAGLKADVSLKLTPARTTFTGYQGFVFDDPARDFRAEPEEIFSGELDANGNARFEKAVDARRTAPGMLNANFTSRVFERGGAFSIQYDSRPFAPYARFVGVKLPDGGRRNTLPLDQDQTLDIASVTAAGAAAPNRRLSVKLYKVDWRWWWDRGQDSLAAFIAREASTRILEDSVTTDARGRAQWKFRLPQAQWGRYLVRVCDEEGGHCSGAVFYADWPYWQEGEAGEGPAATMLELTADKESYQVGETAVVQLPESAQGRALVTVENGSAILDARWVVPQAGSTRISIPVTAAMAPNAYVAVTLMQPHAGKQNDRPIRLYGVIPLLVTDNATTLKPVLQAADEWRPETEVAVKVSEAGGKPMTYTLAVVDEGLLSLTNFRTPDLHQEFFRREALGVRTWDLFDQVSGAYGAALERMLALGGSDAAAANAANQQQSRFPPVAQVLGPFHLDAGRTDERKVTLPRYVGAVRVMVVAGTAATKPAAYGSAEKSVYVRQPLMILPTMPRVVGPGEEISVPVSVFAMNDAVKNVQLTVTPDDMFEVVGNATTTLAFERTGEQIGMLRLRVAQRLGNATVRFAATSGRERARDEIHIEVRSPNPPSTRSTTHLLQPGESWTAQIRPHGMPGTNRVTLEVSRLPPINLEKRLEYLVQYPHGCLEQTTSAVFPQLFLPLLAQLDETTRARTEANVRAGIERLRSFQLASGNFSYWPGSAYEANGYSAWSAIYASHFLVEAEKAGYTVPASLRAGMIRGLRANVQNWRPSESAPLVQAYRLYVLARAGQPEVGAMNRLREQQRLDAVERWVLAAAYQLAGLTDAARALAPEDPLAVREYRYGDITFGSALRDHALVLQSLVVLGRLDRAEPLIREISNSLAGEGWYSTQETAYSLLSVAQLAGARSDGGFSFTRTLAGRTTDVNSTAALHRDVLEAVPDAGADLALRNTSQGIVFATVSVRGTPPAQLEDAAANGLEMRVSYSDLEGNPVQPDRVRQGTDLVVGIEVRNGTRLPIRNIALSHIVPSGWEIHNERIGGEGDNKGERDARDRSQELRNRGAARADYVDVRDDRVLQYFSLEPGATIRFETRVNAAYRGRYYLPGIVAEAMYDATMHASSAGRWTEVVAQ